MIKKLAFVLCFLLHNSFANIAADQIKQLMHKQPEKHAALDPETQDLQQNYFFVLFYRSTCPHCHRFVPILKDFANYYHVNIRAYATDGKDLDGLGGKPMTADQYREYFLQGNFKPVVPALFLQNKYTGQAYAVLFGEAKPYQLAQRIHQLMHHIEEKQPHA